MPRNRWNEDGSDTWYTPSPGGSNLTGSGASQPEGGSSQTPADTLDAGNKLLQQTPPSTSPPDSSGGGHTQAQSFADLKAGGVQSEDYARFGPEEFKRWKPYLSAGCPPATPYKSSRGAEGCYEKPTECPPGQGPQGPDETSPCGGAGYGGGGNLMGAGGGQGSGNWGSPSVGATPGYKPPPNYVTERQVSPGVGGAPPLVAPQDAVIQAKQLEIKNKATPGGSTIPPISPPIVKTGM